MELKCPIKRPLVPYIRKYGSKMTKNGYISLVKMCFSVEKVVVLPGKMTYKVSRICPLLEIRVHFCHFLRCFRKEKALLV